MASDVHQPSEPSTTALVSGIIEDFEQLVKQQMELTRQEIMNDMRKARDAALSLAFGAGVSALGGFSLFFALVYLLHWATGPAGMDPAAVPLWGWYAIVGGVLLAIGMALLFTAGWQLKSIKPLQNPATDALKETVKWVTRPTQPK
jgi:hypothetical protein